MFKYIINLLYFIAGLLSLNSTLGYSAQYDGLISYSEMIQTRAWGKVVQVDYSSKIYDNEVLSCPTIALIDQFTNIHQPTSSIALGWDRNIKKEIIPLAVAFNSQGSYTPVDITLNAQDKDHMCVGCRLRFDFTPTAGFTNVAVVTDKKQTANTTVITIIAYDGVSKIGTSGTVSIPINTNIMILPGAAARGADAGLGVAQFPTTITNEYQDIRWPWELDDITQNEKLYVEGTPENIFERQKRGEFNRLREGALLFNPASWFDPVTFAATSTRQNSSSSGLLHAIMTGGSPANFPYVSHNMDALDTWTALLDNSSLDDVAKTRFTLINSAFNNSLSKIKRDKPGVELAPNDSYGIPGVKTLYWGGLQLDLFRHWMFDKWFGTTDPVACAITLPLIEYRPLKRPYLRMNLQLPGETKVKHELRTVETWLGHQLDTAYFGMYYKNTLSTL
jgi:hypothetical protein